MTANPNLASDQKSLGKRGAFIDDNTPVEATQSAVPPENPIRRSYPIAVLGRMRTISAVRPALCCSSTLTILCLPRLPRLVSHGLWGRSRFQYR